MAFAVSLGGMKELEGKLNKLTTALKVDVSDEINASALKIENQAKRLAPVNFGQLRNSIYLKEKSNDKGYIFTIGSSASYAPYVEFGTGGEVNVPAGYETFAIQFKGKGIRKINLRARPYLIPAFESEIPILRKNIKNVIANVKS